MNPPLGIPALLTGVVFGGVLLSMIVDFLKNGFLPILNTYSIFIGQKVPKILFRFGIEWILIRKFLTSFKKT